MLKVQEISSSKNTQIKLLRKLAQKKYRRQRNQFTVENLVIIYDALKNGHDFQALFVTKDFISRNKEKFEYLQKQSKLEGYYLIDEALNKEYSQLDTPSGITAIYEITPSPFDKSKSVIYLNGIKDPGNIGTILRSALAFDVTNIVLDATCVDVYNFKAINAAKESIFKLSIIKDERRTWLKDNKGVLPIYAANARDGLRLSEIKANGLKKFCLVLGGESHGISEDVIKLVDKTIHIEISSQVNSLNVSCAAAILLYGLTNTNSIK